MTSTPTSSTSSPPSRYLVQTYLPLFDNAGDRLPRALHDRTLDVLTERFGGATAYTQAPAAGLWANEGEVVEDRIILVEVMADTLDREWWAAFRQQLERDYRQDVVMIRAVACEML
jgi:hypothetical protein